MDRYFQPLLFNSTCIYSRMFTQPLSIISAISSMLKDKYGIIHSTIQLEDPSIHDHGPYGKDFMLRHT